MKIGLIDVDSHNFPNLPLMKMSAWHKKQGDYVEFVQRDKTYDKVYISKIFTESPEPEIQFACEDVVRGGSGYDLKNKLPYDTEHIFPDYSLYPQYKFALGFLTRGCPRCNHTFCITPQKDGITSIKVADLAEFWDGQREIYLLDQNLLACKERLSLLKQLAESKAKVNFSGGLDVRYLNQEIIEALRPISVIDYHFAWDDPREPLEKKFELFKQSGLKTPNSVGVYVLTNYWSTFAEDLHRIYALRGMGFVPYVMVYDKQRYVNTRGRWLPDVENRYTKEQLRHFKTCQHLQRWCNNRKIIKMVPNFDDYDPYRKWMSDRQPVPEKEVRIWTGRSETK